MTPDKLVPYDLYEELIDFLNKYSDVVDGSDGPKPNRAMHIVVELEQCRDAPPPK